MQQLPAKSIDDGSAVSQTVRVQLKLRELILGGEMAPGQRIAELALVDRLGASRTPIRMALVRLQEEGLLDPLPGGGFVVKDFSENDIRDAIDLRGTLEGLAARLAAERGARPSLIADARDCLAAIDAMLAAPDFTDERFSGYVEANSAFHALVAEMADSELVARQVTRAGQLPFASPSAFVVVQSSGRDARDMLVVAQHQHHAVLDAIVRREGARAEAIMREHARIAQQNLRDALRSQKALQLVPGASLIRRPGSR